jgi:magnesium chelatase family protein
MAALVGGGIKVRPGEVSLAHLGVLFLDELPEFQRAVLEALRQPLETGRTTVSRANAHITYPARFQLVAAMNPCRCGYLGDGGRECGRAPRCGEEYQARLSGPLLDRIDIAMAVTAVTPAELSRAPAGEPSGTVAARVLAARAIQRARWKDGGPTCNAEADGNALDRTLCAESDARELAERAAEKLGLSARGFTRTLRVARTIADLAGAAAVARHHVAEALALRLRSSGRPG